MRIRACAWLVVAAALVMTGACGVGSSKVAPAFQIAGIGPGGGSLSAGDVSLTIPAGALAVDTAVSIIPQQTPLPIQVPLGDPCTYAYLGPLWCCGPVGQDLNVPAQLVVSYDPALIPAGRTTQDLVLLIWNNGLQVMQPDFTAIHDIAASTFTKNDYIQLGHVAVGVRTCATGAAPGFVVAGGAGNPIVAGETGFTTDGVIFPQGAYVGSVEVGAGDPVQIAGGFTPFSFAPSPMGDRILFESFDGQNESTLLYTAPTAGGAAVLVADDSDNLNRTGIFAGWLLRGAMNELYVNQFVQAQQLNLVVPQVLDPTRDETVMSSLAADGTEDPVGIHGLESSSRFLRDLRQSPDGVHMLLRWQNGFGTGAVEGIDIFNTTTGALVSTDLIPVGAGQHTPRWNADGSAVYGVDASGQLVVEYSPDGLTSTTLYTAGTGVQLQDAVLAPNGTTLATIERGMTGPDELVLIDRSSGSPVEVERLAFSTTSFYDDVLFHPAGNPLYVASSSGVTPYTLDPTQAMGERIVDHGPLPARALWLMDINKTTGELLHTVPLSQLSDADSLDSLASTAGPGLCVTDPIGGDLVQVDLPDGFIPEFARWLSTIRTTAGTSFPGTLR